MAEPMVSFPTKIKERSFLPTAGQYGRHVDESSEFYAEITLGEFEWNPDPEDSRNYPAFDKKKAGRYAFFRFDILWQGKKLFVRHFEPIDEGSGSKVQEMLASLGVEMVEQDGMVNFNLDSVAPRDVIAIEVGDPGRNKEGELAYTGRLTGVRIIGT